MTFEENHFTYLIKPIITESSHCFQLSLTVEVNFPTNSTMITYKNTREKNNNINAHGQHKKGPKPRALKNLRGANITALT